MNADEKLLFKQRYDEVGGSDVMEIEACDELCLHFKQTIEYNVWEELFDDLKEFLERNKDSFTTYAEEQFYELDINEALENEDVIEAYLNDTIISENIEIQEDVKEIQAELSDSFLEQYADNYCETENFLCLKGFPYTIVIPR